MKRWIAVLLCLCILPLTALAAGDASDPAVTRSYLTQVWQTQILRQCADDANAALTPVYDRALRSLAEKTAAGNLTAQRSGGRRQVLGRVMLKQGDVVYPDPGCKILLRSGAVGGGTGLVNVTQGTDGTGLLAVGDLYMQSDTASTGLTVATATAEIWADGILRRQASAETDYGSLAEALFEMGLFRGMGTGFELEQGATRAQGLVMFLRLLGKEPEAMACTASTPFTDVPRNHWAYGYVAYAYSTGLVNGTSLTTFSPDAPVTAQHYMTFLLRALHYDEGTDFTYNTILTDCVKDDLFRSAEIAAVSSGTFARRNMVYLSWYGLFCADGKTRTLLLEQLVQQGAVTPEAAAGGIARASDPRIQ